MFHCTILFPLLTVNTGIPCNDITLTRASFVIKYCKTRFFACPLLREFREPDKFATITGRENLNTVAFQCSREQKRQNYGVQNNYIDSNAKIKGGQN